MDKYYKNFIICAEIDYFCVLCQETFEDEADVDRHMRWEKHRNDLKLQEYLHKFKKDFIYKINEDYYCEVCNVTTTDVASHIKESYHQDQKTKPQRVSKKSSLLKRDGTSVIVNDKTVTRLQWHGIKDNKCSLCNIDKLSKIVNAHILSASHVSNLKQSSIKFEAGNCYRELKHDKFCCFTCFDVYDNKYLASHWEDKHREKCMEHGETSKTETPIEKKDTENSNDPNNNIANIYIKNFSTSYSKNYKIDEEKKTVQCLLCDASLTPSYKKLDKHTSVYHPETKECIIMDKDKCRQELSEYASTNYINVKEGDTKCFCSLCDVYISAHMNCMKQHVEGSLHTGHLELKGLIKKRKHEKPPVKPVLYKTYRKISYGPFNIDKRDVMVFGNGVCIELFSFELMEDGNQTWKCYGCNKTMDIKDVLKHMLKKEHHNVLLKCKVLLVEEDDETDFIREIRPGLYHCGCCNKVFPFWENIAKHMTRFTHKVQRAKNNLVSAICAQMMMSPGLDLNDIAEYHQLRSLDGIH
ncbi:uncharacterized protein [Maniola hyperantus]|uniref:uncharacterized protein n=1 Tax=Aphantopus hyperantus TaxID=2795564 RepID=UPI0021332202